MTIACVTCKMPDRGPRDSRHRGKPRRGAKLVSLLAASEQIRRKTVTQSRGATRGESPHASRAASESTLVAAARCRFTRRPPPNWRPLAEASMPRLLGVLPVLALLVTACKIEPRHVTEPDLTIAQILVAPDTITLDPLGTWTFGVYGRTKTNDSIPVDVQWTASAGSITQRAQFTADSSESDVTITAMLANSALTGSALVSKRRVVQLILQPARAYLLPGQTQQFSTSGVRTSGDTVAINASYRA